MASWLVREKSAPVVTVELLEKPTRLPKPADPSSPRLRRASSRPQLLAVRQVRAQLRPALFALPA